MPLLDKLKTSFLGLAGERPATFGVDPVPPNSLHLTYSTTGTPNVKWRTISGTGPKPAPTRLDATDSKDKYKPGKKYTGK
jgi:hypothetical protein